MKTALLSPHLAPQAPGATIRAPMTRRGPAPHLARGPQPHIAARESVWIGDPNTIPTIGDPNIKRGIPGVRRGIFQGPFGEGPIWAAAGYGAEPAAPAAPTSSELAVRTAWRVGALAAGAALIYHGYKRNRGSVGWALVWGLLGGIVWPITLPIAYAQGFGKPKTGK